MMNDIVKLRTCRRDEDTTDRYARLTGASRKRTMDVARSPVSDGPSSKVVSLAVSLLEPFSYLNMI